MTAMVASRFDSAIRGFYQRFLAVAKPKKVALTACRRKLLVIPNTMLKRCSIWCTKRAGTPAFSGRNS